MKENKHENRMINRLEAQEYEEEYGRYIAAGGSKEQIQSQKFDMFQLAELRKGLKAGLDISQYLDAGLPWFQMEEIRLEMEQGIDMQEYRRLGFEWNQLAQIRLGLLERLEVNVYALLDYMAEQMLEIRLGLQNGVDIQTYADPEYDWFQMREIRVGLERNQDISIYAKKDVPYMKMRQLRKAMEAGIDVSDYLKADYNPATIRQLRKAAADQISLQNYVEEGYQANQLEQIRLAIKNNVSLAPYLNPDFLSESLQEIRLGLEEGLQVDIYADIQYSWFQMREIRLGLEERISVEVYAKPLYLWQQMREIRLGLEHNLDVSSYLSMMYSTTDMQRMRLRLEQNTLSSEEGSEELSAVTEPDVGQVFISRDKMKAYLELKPPAAGKNYMLRDLKAYLNKAGVRKGLNEEVLRGIIKEGRYGQQVNVAEGKPPEPGKDGYYQYFFRTDLPGSPKILEDGSVDYLNMEYFEQVQQGQVLAVYHDAQEGANGYNVIGEELRAEKGMEKPVLSGNGFLITEDRKTYLASMTGKVELRDYMLTISKIHITGDVNTSTGNVSFDGSVFVRGQIGDGVIIEATEDIVVDGIVQGACLKAGRNILLKSGVVGRGQGVLEAGGEIAGKFFESVAIMTAGSLRANYCMNCMVTAKERVIISGQKGILVGGITQARQGVGVSRAGNRAGLKTVLDLGVNQNMMEQFYELEKELSKIYEELRILEEGRKKYQSAYAAGRMQHAATYGKIQQAVAVKESQLEETYRRKSLLEQEIEQVGDAKAMIGREVFPGCIITIDRISVPVSNYISGGRGVTFKRMEKRIAIFKN